MAGELTASTPTLVTTPAQIKAHIDTLTLAATTDRLVIMPIDNGQTYVFKVERAA